MDYYDYIWPWDPIWPVDMSMRRLDEVSQLRMATRMHGTMMLLGWGFFIPAAIACSLLLRHRDKHSHYLYSHVRSLLLIIGTLLIIAGWVIGLVYYDTLDKGPSERPWSGDNKPYAHAVLGMVVMVGTLFYILIVMLFVRKPRHGPVPQKICQIGHRFLGLVLVVLALIACGIGTRITHVYNEEFLKGFVGAMAATALVALLCWADKIRFKKQSITRVNDSSRPEDKVDEEEALPGSERDAEDKVDEEEALPGSERDA
jgi:hypothetical protein